MAVMMQLCLKRTGSHPMINLVCLLQDGFTLFFVLCLCLYVGIRSQVLLSLKGTFFLHLCLNTLISEFFQVCAAADWPLIFLLWRMSDSQYGGVTEGTAEPLCRQTDICFILILTDLYFIPIQLLTQGHQPFYALNALNIFPAKGSVRYISCCLKSHD